jgi:hypothetical protein
MKQEGYVVKRWSLGPHIPPDVFCGVMAPAKSHYSKGEENNA